MKFIPSCLLVGYCSDTLGLFYVTENDATITSHIFKTKINYGDVMIVDRGSRDVLEVFSNLDYGLKMPVYL